MRNTLLGLAAALVGAGVLGIQTAQAQPAQAPDGNAAGKRPQGAGGAKAADDDREPAPSVTEHTITINGQTFKYKVTAGYYYLKEGGQAGQGGGGADEGYGSDPTDAPAPAAAPAAKAAPAKPAVDMPTRAKIFYVAYIREGYDDAAKRPLTFAFNGGPGSASCWLHMGALGPRKVHLTDRGEPPPPPYTLEDNNYSWLDETDLVFIDPMSTGYSRPEDGVKASAFYGYDNDLESVGDFIRLYTTRNERWPSPKFLAGESYGTVRAAGLAGYLEDTYGMYLNGIALISSVLNYGEIIFAPENDKVYTGYLPTYAAAAWYHKRLSPEMEAKPLADVLKEAEDFAVNDYALALLRGSSLSAGEKMKIATRMSELIGIPADRLAQVNLRETSSMFFADLLRDKGRMIGRYDSRYTGIKDNPGRDGQDFDPSGEATTPTISAVFNDYVRRELKFTSDLPYHTKAGVQPWALGTNGYLDVTAALRDAMNRHPYLKVWVVCGYYDLATPFFGARETMDGMLLDPAVRDNLTMTYYESGHMVYLNKPSLVQLKGDFVKFLHSAILPESAAIPTAAP